MLLFRSAPMRYLQLLLGTWLSVFLLTRCLLLLGNWSNSAPSLSALAGLFASGLAYDLFDPQTRELPPRALLGNYQHLGLFDGENLAILSPQKHMRRHNNALSASQEQHLDNADLLLQRDISYYQSASHGLQNHLLVWQPLPEPPQLHEQADTTGPL